MSEIPLEQRVKRRLKSLAEQTFGVRISRAGGAEFNGHSDHDLRALRRWSPDDVVFDVGANDGRTVLRIQSVLNGPRIFAFEPVSATYRVLVGRTSHLPNVTPVHAGLGARSGRRDIYLDEHAALNSFSPQWAAAPKGVETVDVTTIDEQMAACGTPFVHYLKIDTEGSEFDVLQGAEQALQANRIGIIQLEVGFDQIPKGLLSLERARIHLAARGYRLYGIYNQCRGHVSGPTPVLAYCDALFVGASL